MLHKPAFDVRNSAVFFKVIAIYEHQGRSLLNAIFLHKFPFLIGIQSGILYTCPVQKRSRCLAVEKVNGIKVPYVIGPRRAGDVATCYADPVKAYELLGWKAEKNLEDMCRDAWNYQKNNPNGYDD